MVTHRHGSMPLVGYHKDPFWDLDLLFLIFINDIDNDIVNKILKFADDTKLVGAVTNNLDAEKLRSDLKTL